ncbi:hypothetical protein PTKIN_Ptkin04bG0077000 [Pterospermum kingtungense]
MIRGKNIGNLSSSARSFPFSGSRCSVADGNSCTCLEDESCEAERAPQLVSHPILLRRSSTVNNAESTDDAQHDGHASTPISDQFVKAGIAAVSFLSDLMNYKLPLSDGSLILSSPKHCVVESTRPPPNIKSPVVKPVKRENFVKVYTKSGYKRVSNATLVDSSGTHTDSANPNNKRKHIPQRVKAHSHRFMSNFSSNKIPSNAKISDSGMDGFKKSFGDMKMPAGVVPVTRPLGGTGHVVESASQILRGLKWGLAAEQALVNLNFSMDAYQANQVLKQIQDHAVAPGFFYWLKRQAGFKHDSHTYTIMVGILGRAKQFGAINRLLDQMMKDGSQ